MPGENTTNGRNWFSVYLLWVLLKENRELICIVTKEENYGSIKLIDKFTPLHFSEIVYHYLHLLSPTIEPLLPTWVAHHRMTATLSPSMIIFPCSGVRYHVIYTHFVWKFYVLCAQVCTVGTWVVLGLRLFLVRRMLFSLQMCAAGFILLSKPCRGDGRWIGAALLLLFKGPIENKQAPLCLGVKWRTVKLRTEKLKVIFFFTISFGPSWMGTLLTLVGPNLIIQKLLHLEHGQCNWSWWCSNLNQNWVWFKIEIEKKTFIFKSGLILSLHS